MSLVIRENHDADIDVALGLSSHDLSMLVSDSSVTRFQLRLGTGTGDC